MTMIPLQRNLAVILLLTFGVARGGELAELLTATLAHPTIDAARSQVAAADSLAAAAARDYWGAGAFSGELARHEGERFVGVLSPGGLADPPFARDIARYGASYSVPIDLNGAVAAAQRAAGGGLEAARMQQRQATLLKLHDTTTAYSRLQALQRQQEVLAVQRQRVQQTVDRVTEQVATEQASTAELRLAQAELARLKADEVRLDGSIEQTLVALEEAAGQRLTPADSAIPIPDWPADSDELLLPVAVARAQTRTAEAQADAARRALYPGLSVGADYFQFDGDEHTPDAWSVFARVSIPLDAAAWQRASAARAQADAAAYAQQAAQREAQRNWTALKAAYQTALADAAALDQEVVAREEVVRVQAELQRVGLASLEELLRQQRDLLDAESRLAGARAAAVSNWSAAQVLLGTPAERYIALIERTD